MRALHATQGARGRALVKGQVVVETTVPEAPFRDSTHAYGARRIAVKV